MIRRQAKGMEYQKFRQLLLANQLTVREMAFLDLEKVKALSKDVYEGTDDTNSILKRWMENEKWYPFCVESSSGEVIGFTALNITDNETNACIRSSRIAHHFRGKGIYKAMIYFALSDLKKKFPKLEYVSRGKPVEMDIPPDYANQKIITKIVLCCDRENGVSLQCPKSPQAIFSCFEETRISFKDLGNRYKKDEVLRSLFPSNLLTIAGEVFDITEESNMNYLESRKGIQVFLSTSLHTSNVEKMAVEILNLEPRQTDEGVPCAYVDVQSNDVTMAMYHLQRALNFVSSQIGKNFNLIICLCGNLCNYEKEITEFLEKAFLCCKISFVAKYQMMKGLFANEMGDDYAQNARDELVR